MGKAKLREICKNVLIVVVVMTVCTVVCTLLAQIFDDNNPFATSAYLLAVALIARFSTGYFYGIASSIIGVFCVNYMFTYPFYKFDMTLSGYPLTFTVMLLVSAIISALSTQVKRQERLRFEADSEKTRANLLRSVSHDIRTPLASIVGASSALIENKDLPEADREELLRAIHADAQWLIRMTENILSVTRFSAEGVKLQKTEEVVEEIVGSAIVKFRKNRERIPIAVTKPDEILLAPMDATLIEQVLINLFENVVAHGVHATRILVEITEKPGRVEFTVADDGVGIAPEVLKHIFDGYMSLGERKQTDDRRNMGIGLSVCNTIVRAHGGSMRAENNRMGGATFRFWLPCEEDT